MHLAQGLEFRVKGLGAIFGAVTLASGLPYTLFRVWNLGVAVSHLPKPFSNIFFTTSSNLDLCLADCIEDSACDTSSSTRRLYFPKSFAVAGWVFAWIRQTPNSIFLNLKP